MGIQTDTSHCSCGSNRFNNNWTCQWCGKQCHAPVDDTISIFIVICIIVICVFIFA